MALPASNGREPSQASRGWPGYAGTGAPPRGCTGQRHQRFVRVAGAGHAGAVEGCGLPEVLDVGGLRSRRGAA
jgi:hypothetical protein